MANFDVQQVSAVVSAERMARYVAQCGDCEDSALSLYGFNIMLCESFYTPLQCIEIALRNKIHEAMSSEYGSNWLTTGGAPLDPDAQAKIDEIVERRRRARRATEPGDIVADISFGLWVGLLGARYDNTLWRTTLNKAFPGKPSAFTRGICHGRFNMVRRFRNRVAHYEPILHKNPESKHDEIISAIHWLSPDKAEWTKERSKVPNALAEAQDFVSSLLGN